MAAPQLLVPAETTDGRAAGSVISTLQRDHGQKPGPTAAPDLRLQAVGRCWGA
jgi:hypothetical protein